MQFTTERYLQLPARQQLVQLWLDQLCKDNPHWQRAEIAPHAHDALKDFYRYLDDHDAPQRFDLQGLVNSYLRTENASVVDVARIFIMLRAALRGFLTSYEVTDGLEIQEHLDNWTDRVLSRYAVNRAHLNRVQEMMIMERVTDLSILNRSATLLNGSLDTVSVVNLAAQIGADLTGADLCIVFQRDKERLLPLASAGRVRYAGAPITIPTSKLLEPLIVDGNQQDIPLQMVRDHLGIPDVQAMTCSPLRAGNAVIGKLTAVYLQPQLFTAQQISLREVFANHAGQALRNAQLYEQLGDLTAAQERQRIALEMHDTMLQTLVTLNINLRVAESLIEQEDWAQVRECVETAHRLGKVAVDEGRETLRNLNSSCSCNDESLLEVIQSEMILFTEQTGIHPQFVTAGSCIPSVSRTIRHHLRRLLGESFNNIQRHAEATAVEVRLEANGYDLLLQVKDNGLGFAPDKIDEQLSFGISGMRERARLINAHFEVHSAPGQGVTICIRAPYAERPAAESDFS
ncbi:MAG: GAF domain-containing protein [Anaerolineae bacterium]|nr:GAF domain-containing protein [Anaerolineae bacterium]